MSENDTMKLSDLIEDYEGKDNHGAGSMATPADAMGAVALETENLEETSKMNTNIAESTEAPVVANTDTNTDAVSATSTETDKGSGSKTEEDDAGKVKTKANKVVKKKEEVVIPGMITLHAFIEENKDKVVNAKLINLSISSVPVGKYLMYVTNEEKDASLIKIDTPDKLQLLKPLEAKTINVYNSGLAIVTASQRIYTRKSNCVIFDLDMTGHPIAMRTITKKGSQNPVTETAAKETYTDADDLKVLLKKQAVTLFNKKCKDLTTVAEIIPEIDTFRPTCTDVEYQIKLDMILMNTKR